MDIKIIATLSDVERAEAMAVLVRGVVAHRASRRGTGRAWRGRGQRLVRRAAAAAAAAAAASGVEERRGSAQGDFTSLPVVDLGPLVMYTAGLRGLEEDVLQCCREIDAACRRCGFFYVKNHGVPEPLVSGVRELSKQFFRRPRKDKERLRLGASTSFRGYQALGDNVTRFDGGFSRDWHEAIGEAHTRMRAHPHPHPHTDTLTHARAHVQRQACPFARSRPLTVVLRACMMNTRYNRHVQGGERH